MNQKRGPVKILGVYGWNGIIASLWVITSDFERPEEEAKDVSEDFRGPLCGERQGRKLGLHVAERPEEEDKDVGEDFWAV